MPVIEANAIGRPVICSTIPVLKEIAADAAEYVNQHDANDIRRGFFKLINNQQECMNLIEKGKRNVQRFRQNKIFSLWNELYQELL